jgi:hypothetical protein
MFVLMNGDDEVAVVENERPGPVPPPPPSGNWLENPDTHWYETGTYKISTPGQLAGLAKLVNEGSCEQGGFNN